MKFDEKVWKICRKIPAGRVSTYKIIADELGSRGYRAVGNALNRNPYWPEVPCHRVVSSDGTLGGFASGIEKKKELLRREGIKIVNNRIDLKKYLVEKNKN